MGTSEHNEWSVTVRAPDADECYLIGDFNAWSVPGVRMSRVDADTWSATVDRGETIGRVQGVAMQNGRVMRLIQAEVQSVPVRHAIA